MCLWHRREGVLKNLNTDYRNQPGILKNLMQNWPNALQPFRHFRMLTHRVSL